MFLFQFSAGRHRPPQPEGHAPKCFARKSEVRWPVPARTALLERRGVGFGITTEPRCRPVLELRFRQLDGRLLSAGRCLSFRGSPPCMACDFFGFRKIDWSSAPLGSSHFTLTGDPRQGGKRSLRLFPPFRRRVAPEQLFLFVTSQPPILRTTLAFTRTRFAA